MAGLQAIESNPPSSPPRNFKEWTDRSAGKGIARLFLGPYNSKVWAYPPEMLSVNWLEDRVAKPNISEIIRSINDNTDNDTWGPNTTFRFPMRGGTGSIWKHVADTLPTSKIHYAREVTQVDIPNKKVKLSDGRVEAYDCLITTMPLDRFIRTAALDEFAVLTSKLLHNSVYVVGVGVNREYSGTGNR